MSPEGGPRRPSPLPPAECETPQGHQWYFMNEEAGGVEKRFLEKFGNVVRWKGPLGVRLVRRFAFGGFTETTGTYLQEDQLWIADPKAINHILQKSGYLYEKPSHVRERAGLLTDHGILWAGGELPIVIDSSSPPAV